MRRALRWNRNGQLKVVYFDLPGALMSVRTKWWRTCCDAREAWLDWATPEPKDERFCI